VTDYLARLHGVYANGKTWSVGLHITSPQAEAALATTVANAWSAAWTTATTGLATIYPAGTDMTFVTVSTLNAVMKQVSKTTVGAFHAGASGGNSAPYASSIVVRLESAGIQKFQRGRLKLPAPDASKVLDDVLDATVAGHVKTSVNGVFTAIMADGSTVFITSMKDHKNTEGTAFQKTVIIPPVLVATKMGTARIRTKSEVSAVV
jgi:hypothetical protein